VGVDSLILEVVVVLLGDCVLELYRSRLLQTHSVLRIYLGQLFP